MLIYHQFWIYLGEKSVKGFGSVPITDIYGLRVKDKENDRVPRTETRTVTKEKPIYLPVSTVNVLEII